MNRSLPSAIGGGAAQNPTHHRRHVWQIFYAILLSLGCSTVLQAQSKPSEYDVKAAYLFNFGKFIRVWPPAVPAKQGSFDICIVGSDPMGRSLDALTANERIDGRPAHVRRLKDPSEARTCDIVYISSAEGERIAGDIAALHNGDALTVSDSPTFLANGGMIQFVLASDHVRFAVNLNAVKRTHVAVSSELLRVAISVAGKNPVALP